MLREERENNQILVVEKIFVDTDFGINMFHLTMRALPRCSLFSPSPEMVYLNLRGLFISS